MTANEYYDAVDGNYTQMLAKCRKEERIVKYLKMFLADTSYQDLKSAMQAQDWKASFAAAHALKGVTQNLCLDGIAKGVIEITEALRNEDTERARQLMPKVEQVCESAFEKLQEFVSGLEA